MDAAFSVLLVEDNEIVRTVIVEELSDRYGYEIEAFVQAEPALERAEERPFDVVLMDISLPAMDGIEALKKLRSTEPYAKRPVVAMTGHAFPGDKERFLSEGFSEHLGKPFTTGELVDTISRCLPGKNL